MRARFKGWCARGGHRVNVGEFISRDGGRWSHDQCLQDRPGRDALDGRRAPERYENSIPPVSAYAHWNEDAERVWWEENRYDMFYGNDGA